MPQALTPALTTATNAVAPSGAEAMNVTGWSKVSVQRGSRRPSPGPPDGGTQPSRGTPAAPLAASPSGSMKCASMGSPPCVTRTPTATAEPGSGGPLAARASSRSESGTDRRPAGSSSVTLPLASSSGSGRRQTSVT